MKKSVSVIICLLVLGASIGLLLVLSSPTKPMPGPLQISMAGYTNLSENRRVAVFVVTNTNAWSIAFRAFGPQVRSDDGTWPNFASVFGTAQVVAAGATANIQVPPPNDPADWRIRVGYERGPTARERFERQIRSVQSKLGFPELLKAPSKEELLPPVYVEVAREK